MQCHHAKAMCKLPLNHEFHHLPQLEPRQHIVRARPQGRLVKAQAEPQHTQCGPQSQADPQHTQYGPQPLADPQHTQRGPNLRLSPSTHTQYGPPPGGLSLLEPSKMAYAESWRLGKVAGLLACCSTAFHLASAVCCCCASATSCIMGAKVFCTSCWHARRTDSHAPSAVVLPAHAWQQLTLGSSGVSQVHQDGKKPHGYITMLYSAPRCMQHDTKLPWHCCTYKQQLGCRTSAAAGEGVSSQSERTEGVKGQGIRRTM